MGVAELNKRLHINLSEDEAKIVLCYSSYQSQEPYLLKRGKEYITLGSSIINMAYAIYLYKNAPLLAPSTLSQKISLDNTYVIDAIYKHYSLEDMVEKRKGELNTNHLDAVPKLIAAIYREHGFLKGYKFLKPFFENAVQKENIDYKTKVQEYAQAKKLVPQYKILDTTGPNHELIYTCQISVGQQVAVGSAIGKKKAEKEAAKHLIEKYHIILAKSQNTIINEAVRTRVITVQRREQLDKAMHLLEINDQYIRTQQLDEIFTHSSYINEHRKSGVRSNDCLGIVGANVIMVLCGDYILDNYNIGEVSIARERGALLKEENLAKTLPDEVTKYVLKTRNVEQNNNLKAMERLKIDVLKGILAALWINYLETGRTEIEQFTRKFVYQKFEQMAEEKTLDYRTLLQETVQQFGLFYSAELMQLDGNPEHSPIFQASIQVKGNGWLVKSRGFGGSKKAAVNQAAKEMLILLPDYCQPPPAKDKQIGQITDSQEKKSLQTDDQHRDMEDMESTILTGQSGVIAAKAYEGDETLTSIQINHKVQRIEEYAFHSCPHLTRVVMNNSVSYVGRNAFKSCAALETIQLSAGLDSIQECTFRNCQRLKKIEIPEGVCTIREKAFFGCKSLECIVLPSTLRIIGFDAFHGCDSLRTIVLPEGIEQVDLSSFLKCSGLFTLHIPDTVHNITNTTNIYPFYTIIASRGSYAYHWATEHSIRVQEGASLTAQSTEENRLGCAEFMMQIKSLMKREQYEEAYQRLSSYISNVNHSTPVITLAVQCIKNGHLSVPVIPYLEMIVYGGNPNFNKAKPKFKKPLIRLYEMYRIAEDEASIRRLFSSFPSAVDLCKLSLDSVGALIYLGQKHEAMYALEDLFQLGLIVPEEYKETRLIVQSMKEE